MRGRIDVESIKNWLKKNGFAPDEIKGYLQTIRGKMPRQNGTF